MSHTTIVSSSEAAPLIVGEVEALQADALPPLHIENPAVGRPLDAPDADSLADDPPLGSDQIDTYFAGSTESGSELTTIVTVEDDSAPAGLAVPLFVHAFALMFEEELAKQRAIPREPRQKQDEEEAE